MRILGGSIWVYGTNARGQMGTWRAGAGLCRAVSKSVRDRREIHPDRTLVDQGRRTSVELHDLRPVHQLLRPVDVQRAFTVAQSEKRQWRSRQDPRDLAVPPLR